MTKNVSSKLQSLMKPKYIFVHFKLVLFIFLIVNIVGLKGLLKPFHEKISGKKIIQRKY